MQPTYGRSGPEYHNPPEGMSAHIRQAGVLEAEPEITQWFGAVVLELDRMDNLLSDLFAKLQSVSGEPRNPPGSPSPNKPPSDTPVSCRMSDQLAAIRNNLQNKNESVRSMIEALKL